MEVFTLDPTTYTNGKVVNGLKKKLWVERYQDPGEFKFEALPTDEVRTQLARGTLISHDNTLDVMMVEDHEIDEDVDAEPVLTITGRSVTSFIDQRLAVPNNFGLKNVGTDASFLYDFTIGNSWDQAAQLLIEQIKSPVTSGQDAIPNISVLNFISATGTPRERVIKRGQLLQPFFDILKETNSGIRIERPNNGTTVMFFILHNGADISNNVRFDYNSGDVQKAKYFWSNRSYKNGAIINGLYASASIRPLGAVGFGVRLLYVDASDYDVKPALPSDFDLANRVLTARGYQELAKYTETQLLEATISSKSKFTYRQDYNIGDIVYVIGNYGLASKMRVTEYAETEDESGITGFPTLSPV